jgi:hypothetical protein
MFPCPSGRWNCCGHTGASIFRGIFLDLVAKALPDVAIPDSVRKQKWVVHCKPTVQGAENVLTYLGRYVHRVAITDRRILSVDDGKVTFRYQNARDYQWHTMTLPADEFIRRFLQHVLPTGVHKVRYYGLWAPSNQAKLHQIRHSLMPEDSGQAFPSDGSPARLVSAQAHSQSPQCPFCQKGSLLFLRRVPAQQRSPP